MEFQDDVAPGLDPAPARMSDEEFHRLARKGAGVYSGNLAQARAAQLVRELVRRGWVASLRDPPQRDSAQAFVKYLTERHEITNDEVTMIPDLLDIILKHNHDPHDTDLISTVIDLLDYIWNRVL